MLPRLKRSAPSGLTLGTISHLQIIQHLTGQGPARGKAFYQIDRRFGAVRFVAVLLGCDHYGWFV